jgi:hypothetical protein
VGDFAVVGYLTCGWGDAGGELVGRSLGRHPYRLPLPMARAPRRTLKDPLQCSSWEGWEGGPPSACFTSPSFHPCWRVWPVAWRRRWGRRFPPVAQTISGASFFPPSWPGGSWGRRGKIDPKRSAL